MRTGWRSNSQSQRCANREDEGQDREDEYPIPSNKYDREADNDDDNTYERKMYENNESMDE